MPAFDPMILTLSLIAPLALPAVPPPTAGGLTIVETAVAAGRFERLVAALEVSGLDAALDGNQRFTVFAPTDAAFEQLPTDALRSLLLLPEKADDLELILLHHVFAGDLLAADVVQLDNFATLSDQRLDVSVEPSGVFLDDARIVVTDIPCSNGVIHVIDRVLMPNTSTILETAIDAGGFETLAFAVQAADLFDTLQGPGPFTVFAPTNDAFASVPVQILRRLLFPDNQPLLQRVLTFHVVPGRLYAEDVVQMGSLTTLQGSTLDVQVVNGEVFVGGAKVVLADLEARNGNIHVIDGVLVP